MVNLAPPERPSQVSMAWERPGSTEGTLVSPGTRKVDRQSSSTLGNPGRRDTLEGKPPKGARDRNSGIRTFVPRRVQWTKAIPYEHVRCSCYAPSAGLAVYFASHSSLVNLVARLLKNDVIEWFRSEGKGVSE